MTLIVLVLLAVFVAVMMQATSENGKKPVLLSEFVFQYVLIVMLITATALFAAVAMAIKMLLH
jgi:hypothetical protein